MNRFTPQELIISDPSPLATAYAETFVYAPSGEDEEGLGYLYVVAEITSNKTKKENAELLAGLVATLKNEYYKNTIVTPVSALRFALKRANKFLGEEKHWRAPASNLKLKLLVGSLVNNQLHLARLGDTTALILRNDNLQHIISSLRPGSGSGPTDKNLVFENIVSGELTREDKIVLATNQIHRVDSQELTHKLKNNQLVEYLKSRGGGDGIKNLALVALAPASRPFSPLPPVTPLLPKRDKKGIKGRRGLILVLVLLAAVVATTAAALKIRNETSRAKHEAEGLVREITELNSKIPPLIEVKNETEALELLREAREKLGRLQELGYFKTSQATLGQELNRMEQGLKQTETISAVRRVIDLENNSTGFEPLGLALGRNKIFVYGREILYKFDLNRRNGSFENLSRGSSIVSILEKPESPDTALIITSDGVLESSGLGEAKTVWLRSENSPAIKQGEIYNNAFYFLGDDNQIYKLPFEISSTTSALVAGEPALWTKDQNAPDRPSITSFAVDGLALALTGENRVLEFANGDLRKAKDLNEKADWIFTGVFQKNIYLLSSGEGSVVILGKDLNAKKRLSHLELSGAKSLVVNSPERVAYFLKGKSVFSFEI